MKTNEERIRDFSRDCAPFSIMDFENGRFGLGLSFTFLKPPYANYGQSAFNAYAVHSGHPPVRDGMFVRGSGYDWDVVFQKAFEGAPQLGKIEFDSEAGGFYCRSRDLSALIDLGSRFKTICEDEPSFEALVCTALKEADQRQQMRWGGMRL